MISMTISDHNVHIYQGSQLVTTASRLELGAQSPFLRDLLTSQNICDGCTEPTAIIFPREDEAENTLREAFRNYSIIVRRTGVSVVESK